MALIEAVRGRFDIPQRWYRLKAGLLGLDRIADYDRAAPIMPEEITFSFADARELVLDTYQAFSPQAGAITRRFFDERWVDAPVRPHKRGGAFCAYTVPSVHPYVMLNFTARRRDVLVMAHELGHGLHAALAQPQGVFHQSTPLTLAETASVFGEALVFGRLLDAAPDDNARLGLLAERIDGSVATVFRQMALNRFEHLVHTRRRAEGELSVERISESWVESQTELFGDSVQMTEGYRSWWSYIPHFINTPGYVYAYAYGQLLAMSVYRRYVRAGRVVRPSLPRAAVRRRLPRARGAGRDRRHRPDRSRLLGLGAAPDRRAADRRRRTRRRSVAGPARRAAGSVPGAAGVGALLLLEHHVGDQLEDLLDPGRPGVALGKRLLPVADVALGGQLVEVRTGDRQRDLGVGGDAFGHLGSRQLDAVELDVTPAP